MFNMLNRLGRTTCPNSMCKITWLLSYTIEGTADALDDTLKGKHDRRVLVNVNSYTCLLIAVHVISYKVQEYFTFYVYSARVG